MPPRSFLSAQGEVICLTNPVMAHFQPCKGGDYSLFYLIVSSMHLELDCKQLEGSICAFLVLAVQ